MKYIAIKIRGLKNFIWFQKSKTKVKEGLFNGKEGWGEGGALTEIKDLNTELIDCFIYSDALQY